MVLKEVANPMFDLTAPLVVDNSTMDIQSAWLDAESLPVSSTAGAKHRFNMNDTEKYVILDRTCVEVRFKIVKAADGTAYNAGDKIAVECGCPIYSRATITVNNKLVEDLDAYYLEKATHVRRLMDNSIDYTKTTGTDYLFIPDTGAGGTDTSPSSFTVPGITGTAGTTVANSSVNWGFGERQALMDASGFYTVSIPLREYLGLLRFYNRVIIGYRLTFDLFVNDMSQILFRASGVADGKISIDRARLRFYYVVPSPAIDAQLKSFLAKKEQVPIAWETVRAFRSDRLSYNTTRVQYRVGNLGKKPAKVVFFFQNQARTSSQASNSSMFDSIGVSQANIRINSAAWPNAPYTCDFSTSDTVELYDAFLASSGKMLDTETGTAVSRKDFKNLWPMLCFPLSHLPDNLFINTQPSLTLEATVATGGASSTDDFYVYCVVFEETNAVLSIENGKIDILPQ